jgi:hypothetical protein
MSGLTSTMRVEVDSELTWGSFRAACGCPKAMVEIGEDQDLMVYGDARAIHRLAEQLLLAADSAERLDEPAEAPWPDCESLG